MKYAIPLGAILLIGIASSNHFIGKLPTGPGRSASVRAESTPGPVEPQGAFGIRPSEASAKPESSRRAPGAVAPSVSGEGVKKALGTLERGVGLTSTQLPAMEQVLRDRESDIRNYHLSIRKSGILDMQEFGWKTDLMKEFWYRRIDALLDAEQHVRFLALLEKGFLNEGLEFTVEPGMTVLD